VLLDWNAAGGATRYIVQVANAPSFRYETLVVNTLVEDATQYSLEVNTENVLYWRVAVLVSDNEPGVWSAARRINVRLP
jgi:hypothetical protein